MIFTIILILALLLVGLLNRKKISLNVNLKRIFICSIVLLIIILGLLIVLHNKNKDNSKDFSDIGSFKQGSDRTIVDSTDCNNPELENDILELGFSKKNTSFDYCRTVRRDSYFIEPKHFRDYGLEVSGEELTRLLSSYKHEDRNVSSFTIDFKDLNGVNHFTIDSFLNKQIQKFGNSYTTQSMFPNVLANKTVFITYPDDFSRKGDVPILVKVIYGKYYFQDPTFKHAS